MWTIVRKISSWISDINLNYARNVSHFSPDIRDSTTTNMSFTFALTGRSNVLSAKYFPPIDLTDGEYELGLVYFETCNTSSVATINFIFAIKTMRSRFSSSDGSHELEAINKFLRRRITNMYPWKTRSMIKDDDDEYPIVLRTNNNSMQS